MRIDKNYGLYFADVSALNEMAISKLLGKEFDKSNCNDFLRLLRGIHKFLGGFRTDERSESERQEVYKMKNKFLYISTLSEMTRMTLITAYYYLYNCTHENDDCKNFTDFFKNFKFGGVFLVCIYQRLIFNL